MDIDHPDWNHETLVVDGFSFHAVTSGTGPVALMLHGFPENWYSWRHQVPALATAGYLAVAVDLRGYNRTDRPTSVSDYHIDKLCDDVRGLIDTVGGQPVHLVGHDWGGAIAWTYASRMPETLSSLSILNAPPKAFSHHLLRNPAQMRRSWYILFFQIPWLPEALIRMNATRQFVKTFRGWARRKEMFPDEVVFAFRDAMLQPGALSAGINYYRAAFRDLSTFGQARKLPNLTVPTQVIWGDEDRALGKELCDGLEAYVDAPYEIHHIPDCSHWVQQEQPEQVNALLVDFLNRQKGQ